MWRSAVFSANLRPQNSQRTLSSAGSEASNDGLKFEAPPPPDGFTGPTAYLNCVDWSFHFGIFLGSFYADEAAAPAEALAPGPPAFRPGIFGL